MLSSLRANLLKRKRDADNDTSFNLEQRLEMYDRNRSEAAKDYWYEMLKGIKENLAEFF